MDTEQEQDRRSSRNRRYPTGFPIRCTLEEKAEIYARAERASRSASRFLVQLGTSGDGEPPASRLFPEDLSILEGLMVQLRRVGTNLHELARREHAFLHGETYSPSDDDVEDAVREVSDVIDQIRSRIL